MIRDDLVFVQNWLEHLHGLVREIERRIEGKSWEEAYIRGSVSKFQPTREKQIESIREICKRMLELKPRVNAFIGSEPATPTSEIETLLSFAYDTAHQE
jgi:hypothetical protein